MPNSITGPLLFALIQNTALLLAFIVLFSLVLKRPYLNRVGPGRILSGILLMLIGMGIMSTPFYFAEGVIFDTRTILLSVSGLFFGWIPTLIAMVGTSLFRLEMGGPGAAAGVLTIISSGLVGLIWRAFWKHRLNKLETKHLYLFGLSAHIPMAIIIPVLLGHVGPEIYWIVTPAIIIFYPFAGMLGAYLLLQRIHDRENVEKERAAALALREAKEAAEAASRAKSEFLAVISHELMTPLNHIIGPSEMVSEQLNDPELKQMMAIVLGGSHQLKQHFERLLAFAEIERRSNADAWGIDTLQAFIKTESKPFEEKLAQQGIQLETTVDENLPDVVRTDYAMLHTVLENLLENALKFVPKGKVSISLKRSNEDNHLELIYEDEGPGISDAEKEFVFLPFQQRDMSLCRPNQGIGIGLALCHRLAKARDAELKLEDSNSGGCRFVLTFPAEAESETITSGNAA